MSKLLIMFLMLVIPICCGAMHYETAIINNSKQLLLVTTQDWNSTYGYIQIFERDSKNKIWKTISKPMAVVLGRKGLGSIKKEGDNLTPVGIYRIGPIFGFDKNNDNKKSYFPIIETSICVDDVKSIYYNQLIDSAKVYKKDWNSGEQMQNFPQYKLGAVVQYNINPIRHGAGSCIFLHIWKGPKIGTSGCIGMEESNLKQITSWLIAEKNPSIVILPLSVYQEVKKSWALP